MTCLPVSGGCERHLTDPFVECLNDSQGTCFAYQTCFHHINNEPQPEALYSATDTGARLVIERKSVVWPLNYVKRHQNDHLVAAILSEGLRELADLQPLSIRLEPSGLMSRKELESFARDIVASVRSSMDTLRTGRVLGSQRAGRSWTCNVDFDRDPSDGPLTGLIVRWPEPLESIRAEALPAQLTQKLLKLLDSTVKKFSGYPDARRILLLDPHGSIRHKDGSWWHRALKPLPTAIPEIWLGIHDWVTDFDQGWEFEQVFPIRGEPYALLDGQPLYDFLPT
jgi:hypothetical protein